MQKAVIGLVLTLCSAFALAQTPSNKHKTVVSKAAPKPKLSASEEATAAAQAEAIAQAAARMPSPVAPTAAPAVVRAGTPPAAAPATASAMPTWPAKPVATALPATVSAAAAGASHDAVSAEELAIAQRVHQGQLACELGASIRVEQDAAQPGYFHLQGKGFRYRMRPVVTSTGAIRLEDSKAGVVWLQLANKSMLMDQKQGRRVADECANAEQLAYAQSMKTNPPPKLFDTTGMGR